MTDTDRWQLQTPEAVEKDGQKEVKCPSAGVRRKHDLGHKNSNFLFLTKISSDPTRVTAPSLNAWLENLHYADKATAPDETDAQLRRIASETDENDDAFRTFEMPPIPLQPPDVILPVAKVQEVRALVVTGSLFLLLIC